MLRPAGFLENSHAQGSEQPDHQYHGKPFREVTQKGIEEAAGGEYDPMAPGLGS